MKECIAYKKLDKKTVECQACSHYCTIENGNIGICGIRHNIEGKLYLLTYGKAIAENIDPVEKKPLFHFLPGSRAYSFGTYGCNLRCANCQNFGISQMFGAKGMKNLYEKIDWGNDAMPEDIIKEAKLNACESIAYTYNEPSVFLEYALDTMKLAKKNKIKNVWVSNGYMSPETIDAIIPYLDAINIDIKSFDEKFYQKICGAHLAPILENCKQFIKEKIWLEITTLVIPTLSDDPAMLKKIARFIKKDLGDFVPWHVSAFSAKISWKLQRIPDASADAIKKAYDIGKKEGLAYVYAGNILDKNMESTYCPKCHSVVIERLGYNIKRMDNDGRCRKCGEKIEGIFLKT